MLIYAVVGFVALGAALLTFFSGFGLGTLLLPAFALFFPIDQAVALTAVVHFANGLFKLMLMHRHVDRRVYMRFGVPAILAAAAGAGLLMLLPQMPRILEYELNGRAFQITPEKLVVGALLLAFAAFELVPAFSKTTFSDRWLPAGGLLSGFFGGLAGMQGALRAAFLAKAGLTKEAFVATGSAISCTIDAVRIAVYAATFLPRFSTLNLGPLGVAAAAAFLGTLLGKRCLHKLEMPAIQKLVGGLLILVGLGLITGLL